MATPVDWTLFSSYVQTALRQGAAIDVHRCEWDASLGCEVPYVITLTSQPPDNAVSPFQQIRDNEICWLDISSPCRKCPTCLKNRSRLWAGLMRKEILSSNRTWMATFTINPHWRFMFSLRSGSTDYLASYGEISKEITKYLKRLRKAGFKYRYVLVAEAHKDGYPHLHALIHEVSTPIPKSRLQSEWTFGFTTFKLITSNAATFYVAKYLAKDARTRIRASQRYGQSARDLSLEFPIALAHRIFNQN